MSPEIAAWKSAGEYIEFGPLHHKVFVRQLGSPEATAEKTLLLLHGFPESSFSYHAVVDGLMHYFDRIVLFDMLGYGLSDKPAQRFSYSLFEQADTAFAVWKHFGLSGGHLLSHDMGVSVATEIVARHEQGLLPDWFSEGLQSLTFTNGSMVLEMAKLRITQKFLLTRYGHLLSRVVNFGIFKHQVSSAHGNGNLSEREIRLLWELNTLQDGNRKVHLTIRYLLERKRFEKTRWLPAMAQTSLPIHLCWGEDDAVARVAMAHHLKKNVCKNATLTIMKGLGHFCQLGNPKEWLRHVGAFYSSAFVNVDTNG